MKNVIVLAHRELMSLLFSPIAYLTAAGFLVMTGILFMTKTLVPGQESYIGPLFTSMAAVFVLCIPVLTMRLLADEYATGTIETLMTAPVTDAEVVISKWLSAYVFYVALLVLTLVHVLVMALYGSVDLGVMFVAYLGMLLLGGLFVAVGVFASSITRYQLVAAIVGIGLLSVLTFVAEITSLVWPNARAILAYMNVLAQFDVFSRGILDTSGLIFFLSTTAFFLFLSVKVVESKRWR